MRHNGSDKWLNVWHHADDSNINYILSDESRELDTKFITGYCYLNKPICIPVYYLTRVN